MRQLVVAGTTLNASWRSQVHELYPTASHVALYDDLGQRRLWTERRSASIWCSQVWITLGGQLKGVVTNKALIETCLAGGSVVHL